MADSKAIRDKALATLAVIAIVGCFANFWWTSHVVTTQHTRWCSSIGAIGRLKLLPAGPEDQSRQELNALIIHFRTRSNQIGCATLIHR